MRKVVEEVSAEFSELEGDSFTVAFNHGNYAQFWKDANKEEFKRNPVIWLVMPYAETVGSPLGEYQASNIEIAIFMQTEAGYSQNERDELVFKPKLFPVYEELINQISKRVEFGMPNRRDLTHKRIIRPFWGGGEPGGSSQQNLMKTYVDAVYILDLKLTVKKIC